MAGITQLAQKKIDLLFPGEHERKEWLFIQTYIVQPTPTLIYNPGLTSDQVIEFGSRCDLIGITVVGLEVKDEDHIPLESHSWEQYLKEYDWSWIRHALRNSTTFGNGNCYYPVADIAPEIIRDYLRV